MCPCSVAVRTAMGAVAFLVLVLAEFGLAVLVFGRSATQFAIGYSSVPDMIGLAAQIVFAMFPVIHVWGQ
jgi:hypothetical protein